MLKLLIINNMKRILLDIILLLVIIMLPWEVSVLVGLFILFYLKSFTEFILFGLILDIFHSGVSLQSNISAYRFTLAFIVIFLISYFLKKRLKFYSR